MLLATAAMVRVLMSKSVIVSDECVGFRGRPFVRYQFCFAVDKSANTSSGLLRLKDPSWVESLETTLHASGLHKLPLLFNVLRGDMSLIGPRPITVQQL